MSGLDGYWCVVPADDEQLPYLFPAPGDGQSLAELQRFVDGNVECVELYALNTKAVDLWCNEEGLFTKRDHPNRRADQVLAHWAPEVAAHNRIFGDAVLAGLHMQSGRTVALDPAFLGLLTGIGWMIVIEET